VFNRLYRLESEEVRTEMDDKNAIINEVMSAERIYIDENATMEINTLNEFDDLPECCSKCKEPLVEIYARPDNLGANNYGLVVLECEKCSTFYSFWIEPYTFDDTYINPAKEDLAGRIIEPPHWKYKGKPEWGEGKQPRFSKRVATVYEKVSSQLENIDKKITTIIQSKQAELHSIGLSIGTIQSARNKMRNHMKNNSVTSNQLTRLFVAAIYEASHEEYVGANGYQRVGEKIGECQLEEIFGVTRKTIRRWRKVLTGRYPTKIG